MPTNLLLSGGFRGGGAAAPPLASFRKIHGLPISKTVRTADSTVIIITNFYLAASSHEIFLTVRGREGMKGLGALQRHQLPHPPCKNRGSATALTVTVSYLMPATGRGALAIPRSVRPSVCLSQGATALGAQLPLAIATAGHRRCADCGPVRGRT